MKAEQLISQPQVAKVELTLIGPGNTLTRSAEMTTDLPDAAMGETVGDLLRDAWACGMDPASCVMVLRFS